MYKIGQYYRIPCVYCYVFDKEMPVRLPMHHDAHELDFPYWHYHYDFRFFSKSDYDQQLRMSHRLVEKYGEAGIYACALTIKDEDNEAASIYTECKVNFPKVNYKLRKFQREDLDFPPGFQLKLSQYIGKSLINGKCPHKGYDLSTTPPNESGEIVCPCHGLVFDSDGLCIKSCVDYY